MNHKCLWNNVQERTCLACESIEQYSGKREEPIRYKSKSPKTIDQAIISAPVLSDISTEIYFIAALY